jgi:hypothetical protein
LTGCAAGGCWAGGGCGALGVDVVCAVTGLIAIKAATLVKSNALKFLIKAPVVK